VRRTVKSTTPESLVVRDHSKPCEHGSTSGHYPHPESPGFACPGGKEIVLRSKTIGMFEVPESGTVVWIVEADDA
jgi:hypothetical protein